MANRKITSKSTDKIPAYVAIYNILYSDIVNGVYEDGSRLPSETALAKRYKVSRNTIRLALAILNEDGLIQKSQGRGTIVTNRGNGEFAYGQKISNPIIRCAQDEIDVIDISFNYGPPTEVAQRKLGIKITEIVMASNNVYYSGGAPIGHAFIQIPVKHFEDLEVQLNSEKEVSSLINNTIFEMADRATINLKLVFAEENITSFLQIQPNEPVLFIETILLNSLGEGLARCKFYFLPDMYDLSFTI